MKENKTTLVPGDDGSKKYRPPPNPIQWTVKPSPNYRKIYIHCPNPSSVGEAVKRIVAFGRVQGGPFRTWIDAMHAACVQCQAESWELIVEPDGEV